MSMTAEEVACDAYMSELYEEHKRQAIEEFTEERLQSYYIDNKELAKPSVGALVEARALLELSCRASLVFSAIAIEAGIRDCLLRPIIFGLTHDEPTATLIAHLVMNTPMDKYRKLLFHVLREQGGIDIVNRSGSYSDSSLWEEVGTIRKLRNAVVHKAEKCSIQEAKAGLSVASEIVDNVFPHVVNKTGLHIHDRYRLCDDWTCRQGRQ